MRPRVSVVMPVRDGAATVREALDSLLHQTIAEVEVVVIDDGSRDGTAAILDDLARDEPRLEVIHTEGVGIGAALGLGLVECRAPFVARLDADDLCAPARLEAQLTFLDAHPEVVLCGTHVTIAGLGGEEPGEGMARHAEWIAGIRSPEDVRRELWVECPILHPTFCFRREEVVRAGGYRAGPFPEDYELVLRLAARGHAMANVPRELVTWRDSPARASRVLPQYSRETFFRLKAEWLSWTRLAARPAIVWGAGKVGRFVARELLRAGVELAGFVDIDPAKWGRSVRERPVWRPDDLPRELTREPRPLVLGAVGTLGARALIRDALGALGLTEVDDFVMVA